MRQTLLSILAVPALLFALFGEAAGELKAVTLEDHGKLRSPGAPVLSKDGRFAAYALEGRIHVVPVAGGEPRAVTTGGSSAFEPRWSKDGDALYFLSDRSGTTQLWRLPLDEFGEAQQLSFLEGGLDALRLSPDETRLLVFQDGDEGEAAPEGLREPWVIDYLDFKEDANEGYVTAPQTRHLYVYDLKQGTHTLLAEGVFADEVVAWSPDGRRAVFAANRDGSREAEYRTDLWVVDVEAEAAPRRPVRLTDDEEVKSAPAWSPDGESIAYLSAEDGVYGIGRLALRPVAGGEPRFLTDDLDRWVRSFRYSEDGRYIYFDFYNHGSVHLARVAPANGRIERLIEGEMVVTAYDFDSRGGIAARASSANGGPEIWYGRSGGRVLRLTSINEEYLGSRALGPKEKIRYETADGIVVEAFVTKPADFVEGRRYPTILNIHGGPVDQFTWGYDFTTQFLAANGYLVIEPNPRGSIGRGQAFVRAIYRSWGVTDYPDVIAAVDHAIALGYADPDRLAVTGYSYGGYMTNVIITRTDRFLAAASGAGHSFIAANFGHDIYQKWYNWELGLPFENREAYDRLSPLINAGRVSTPTLFLGGREDWNVPILNAELFYQTLRKRGIDTRLVVYPDTRHGGWPAAYSKDYLQRVVDWFDRYLR